MIPGELIQVPEWVPVYTNAFDTTHSYHIYTCGVLALVVGGTQWAKYPGVPDPGIKLTMVLIDGNLRWLAEPHDNEFQQIIVST